MPGRDVAGAPPLLQQLLNHAQRDPETVGNLDARAFRAVIGKKNAFTEILGERSHGTVLPHPIYPELRSWGARSPRAQPDAPTRPAVAPDANPNA